MKGLIDLTVGLAESFSRYEEGKRESELFDQLVRAAYGSAYAVICASDTRNLSERAAFLDKALTRTKEVKMLLDGCYRMKLVNEAFNNRAERKLASIIYHIKKERSSLDGAVDKTVMRLPRAKNVFHTRRLTVRTFLKSDIEKLLELFSDTFYKECTLTAFDSESELYNYLKTLPPFYAVTRKGSGDTVGAIGIFSDGHSRKRVRVELGLLPGYRACGYFSELVEGVSEYAFDKLEMNTVSLYLPGKRSYLSRALMRLGFTHEGTLFSYEKDGEDTAVYSLNKK